MFFVIDGGHTIRGPYWHRRVAEDVARRMVDAYIATGIAACSDPAKVVMDRTGRIPILVQVIERQMLREAEGWQDHTVCATRRRRVEKRDGEQG